MKLSTIFAGRDLALPRFLPLLFIALFIGLAYYPSLGVPFLFDDFHNIAMNPAVQPTKAGDFLKVFQSEASHTRPLALFTFAVNFWFHGLDVVGYHYVNICIHIANAVLLYFLLLRLPWGHGPTTGQEQDTQRRTLVSLAVLFWALNPVQTQAVTYIVQRMTSLATFFYLAALLLFCRFRQGGISGRWALVLITACFALGMASKEMAATLPLALLLFDFCFFHRQPSRKTWLIISATAAGFVLLGLAYLGGRVPDFLATYPNRNFSPWQRLMTEWRMVWHYLEVFAWPHPSQLRLTYDPVVSQGILTPWTTLAGLLAILATLAGAWTLRHRYPLAAAAICFYFLAQGVESTFLNLEIAFVHRIYLPSILLPAALLSMIPARLQRRTGLACLLLIGLWSYWTVSRNVEWQHLEQFWQLEAQRGGGQARALNNQAAWLLKKRYDPASTILLMQKGLEQAQGQDRAPLLYNLALAYQNSDNLTAALATWKQLTNEFGIMQESLLQVGEIFLAQGEGEKLEKMIQQLESNEKIRYQAALLRAAQARKQGNHQAAATLLEEALALRPELQIEISLRDALARTYIELERYDEAYAQLLRITRLDPSQDGAWLNIAHMLEAAGKQEQSAIVHRFLQSQRPVEGKREAENEKKAPSP